MRANDADALSRGMAEAIGAVAGQVTRLDNRLTAFKEGLAKVHEGHQQVTQQLRVVGDAMLKALGGLHEEVTQFRNDVPQWLVWQPHLTHRPPRLSPT